MYNQYVRSEIQESNHIADYLLTGENNAKDWIVPGVPSAVYCMKTLAPQHEIEQIDCDVKRSIRTGRYHALVTCKRGTRTHIGAATSKNAVIAEQLAFRNSVRQLMNQIEKLGFKTDSKTALRRYA